MKNKKLMTASALIGLTGLGLLTYKVLPLLKKTPPLATEEAKTAPAEDPSKPSNSLPSPSPIPDRPDTPVPLQLGVAPDAPLPSVESVTDFFKAEAPELVEDYVKWLGDLKKAQEHADALGKLIDEHNRHVTENKEVPQELTNKINELYASNPKRYEELGKRAMVFTSALNTILEKKLKSLEK